MTGFLVECRLQGQAKHDAKDLIFSIAQKFRVRGVTSKKVVPHMTLYGPGEARNIRDVATRISKVARRYSLVPFEIDGFDSFDGPRKVVYLNIRPSEELRNLRRDLSNELRSIATCQSFDHNSDFAFHSTIAFKDVDEHKFKVIQSYLGRIDPPHFRQYLTRITVLGRGGKIACEYVLLLERLLSRRQALSRHWYRRTMEKLRESIGAPVTRRRRSSLLDRIRRLFGVSR